MYSSEIGELDADSWQKLTQAGAQERNEYAYLAGVDGRAAEIMRVGVRLIADSLPTVAQERPKEGEADYPTVPARYLAAAVLHLVGEQARGQDKLQTPRIVIARSLELSNTSEFGSEHRIYDFVTARLQDVEVAFSNRDLVHRGYNPRGFPPWALFETGLVMEAFEEPGSARVQVFDRHMAWIGVDDMPASWVSARQHFGSANRISQVATLMLDAIASGMLNPRLHTHQYLATLSPLLAAQAADVELPLSVIDFSLLLPDWAKATTGS